MPVAEIIAIGTELLLGQIQDTNTSYIARTLNESGIDIFRATIIGDNEKRIAGVIQETLKRADIIITTGGLGPTVDDPTRNAVALAFGTSNEYHPELWEEVKNRFMAYGRIPTDNNKRQAYLPFGASVIHNPVGTAPAFFIERENKIVFSLPGVPSEMKTLLHNDVIPMILSKFQLESVIVTRVIHTINIGESSVDEIISDLEKLNNPTVGLAAHPGQVDIRITAKAQKKEDALALIRPVELQIEKLLGDHVYGVDQTTILDVVRKLLDQHDIKLVFYYHRSNRELLEFLFNQLGQEFKNTEIDNHVDEFIKNFDMSVEPDLLMCVFNNQDDTNYGLDLTCKMLKNNNYKLIRYGGHPSNYLQWASNQILGFIRETILKEKGGK